MFKISAAKQNDLFQNNTPLRGEAYMRKLEESIAQAERGEFVVTKSADEIINQLKALSK